VRLRQRAEPSLELLALRPARAAERLGGDRLQHRERILDAVVELLDQQIVKHLAAGDLGRHPHRKGEADHQQNGAHHACYREVAPERRDQRAFGDAGGNGPAGERGAGKARNQRHALERYRRHGGFGIVEHLRIERVDARLPTVSCGFGTRAKLVPSPSKIEIVQSLLGRCCSIMA
jgi:hypothetical protein